MLSGRGGTELTRRGAGGRGARDASAGRGRRSGLPGTCWVEDPWPVLCDADVVVTHAGQNAIADVAAARRPAVVIAQPRPHDEQLATARALHQAQLAVVCSSWPAPSDWNAVLDAAVRLGGSGWESLEHRDGSRARRRRARGAGMRTAVITIVAGRHDHLASPARRARRIGAPRGGRDGRARGRALPTTRRRHERRRRASRRNRKGCRSPARATRVLGARWTRARNCSCSSMSTASPARRSWSATRRRPSSAPALLCGPVAYLPPAPPDGYPAAGLHALATPHPARPVPPEDEVQQRRRSCAVLDAVLRRHRDDVAAGRRVLRGLRRLRRRGHRLRPARQARRRRPRGGSAEPGPITSTTRPRPRPSATSPTSSATPRSFTGAGAGGR